MQCYCYYVCCALWMCYECVMNVLWMCYESVMRALWKCYESVMKVLWKCYESVMKVLWKCYGCVMGVLWVCYGCVRYVMDVWGMLWTCQGCMRDGWMMDILYLLYKLYCKGYCNCDILVVCDLTVMLIFVFCFSGLFIWPIKYLTPRRCMCSFLVHIEPAT